MAAPTSTWVRRNLLQRRYSEGCSELISRRTLLAIAALILAAVAGLASYSYLHNVQNRAYHNAKLVGVYTLSGPVPAGTTGAAVISQGLVRQGKIPQQYLPADAVTDLATIRSEVAATRLSSGQILESGLFTNPATAAAATPAQAIPHGDVAITVSVDSVHGVAGLIRPGNLVDILVETAPGVEQFLYQNVSVLAVGTSLTPAANVTASSSSSSTTVPSNTGLITFAVPADAAQRIALAQSGGGGVQGSLYLTLVPPDNQAQPLPPISPSNLIPASIVPS